MKRTITIGLLILIGLKVWAQDISITLNGATIEAFIQAVEQKTDYTFVYGHDVTFNNSINIDVKNAPLKTVLEKVLHPNNIKFVISGKHITLVKNKATTATSQTTHIYTINGYVKDRSSRETLIGATAYAISANKGAVTNSYGFYSLTLPEGDNIIKFSYIGYEPQTHKINLLNDTTVVIWMTADNKIEEVVVEADRPETGSASSRTGSTTMPVEMIKRQPALLGEPDVLKALQTLPGVQRGMAGTSGIHVRGGGVDQNLYLLDGVPMYNIDHILGFMSAFTPDAVKHVDFYKASFPSRYSGRLSSVIDVRTKDGNMQEWHGMGQIGTLSSHMSIEGPIKKDKTSMILSARRSYFDLIAGPIVKSQDDIDKFALNFYDINAKLNHIFSEKNRIYASFYMGRDVLGIEERENENDTYTQSKSRYGIGLRWGNTLGSLRWNHIFTPKIFANTTLAYNKFNFGIKIDDIEEDCLRRLLPDYGNDTQQSTSWKEEWNKDKFEFTMRHNSGIDDMTAMIDLDYHPIPSHHVKFGGLYISHTFRPSMTLTNIFTASSDTTTYDRFDDNDKKMIGNEIGLYCEDDMSLGKKWQLNMGFHATLFAVDGKAYKNIEPRMSSSYTITQGLRAKASYTTMHQYVHLLQAAPISLPADLWVPISKNIKPMFSQQVSFEVSNARFAGWEMSVEAYYKNMRNILEYKDGSRYTGSTQGWQELVSKGKGQSKGLEFMVRRFIGNTIGAVSYTLSKTDRKYGREVSRGMSFPYKYDRRNVVNIMIMHKFGEKIDIAASWNYMSGSWETVAKQQTMYVTPVENDSYTYSHEEGTNRVNMYENDYYDRRNNYHLMPSHQLDLSVNLYRKLKHCTRTINISVINAYNKKNQDFVYTKQKTICKETTVTDPESGDYIVTPVTTGKKTVLCQTSFIPIIPAISYTIKF